MPGAAMSHKTKHLYEFGQFRLDAQERLLLRAEEQRFQSASGLGFALEALSTPSGSRLLKDARLAWIVAAVAIVALLAALPFTIAYLRHAPVNERVVRSFIFPPEKSSFNFSGR